ncbi:Ubiquitin-conjugating enzyme E2 14 [Coemansia sp. RSA 552]|nr:Ubiquitin-conjugating enzyme E2 14 [Coemansia sp. RSA 552]
MKDDPSPYYSVGLAKDDNLFEWSITLFGPAGTLYEGGMFQATMKFPSNYPFAPPELKFDSHVWHPNVYTNGLVCISILHQPSADPSGYEDVRDRWNPAQTVDSILVSVLSMLSDPNDESPANVDAAIQWRTDRKKFELEARRCAEKTLMFED